MNMRAGIYTRISDDHKNPETGERDGLGVARQEKDARELAARLGWEVVEPIYCDNDISAYSGRERPDYQRLLGDIETRDVQAVIAWHPDRLHRSPRELEDFIDLMQATGCQVATVQAGGYDLGTDTGQAVARTIGAWAHHESAHKAARVRRKMRELREAGEDHGGTRAFGWEKDRKTIRPAEAELIREAATRILGGESLRAVVQDWNQRQLASTTGKAWRTQSLRQMLISARISGRRERVAGLDGRKLSLSRRGELIAGMVDGQPMQPIIDIETSDALRALLSDPARQHSGRTARYLLTGDKGVARCGGCGRPLFAKPRHEHGRITRTMVCIKLPGDQPGTYIGCGRVRIVAEPVERGVVAAVLEAVDKGALQRLRDKSTPPELLEEQKRIELKQAALGDAWGSDDDQLDFAALKAASARLQARDQEIKRRIQASKPPAWMTGLPDDKDIRMAWDDPEAMPLARKQALIKGLIKVVMVKPADPNNPHRNRFDDKRVVIEEIEEIWNA